MKLIYFKSDIGNFGDDLNPWLWEKLLGDFTQYKDIDFVGVGSILDERIKSEKTKVVFGSGIRDFDLNIEDFAPIDIRFVRGPISSKITGAKYISDSAYALRLLPKQDYIKKYKISFIPYFRHVNHFNWKMFEKITGIHVILPTMPIDKVIEEIQSSKNILSAAMHGCILADAYRIPWMRVKFSKHGSESSLTSEIKWDDWLKSVKIKNNQSHTFGFSLNSKLSIIKQIIITLLLRFKFKQNKFTLSRDDVINEIDKKLAKELVDFKDNYLNV
ncbi:hypothetical protein [Mesoflavibacter sp. CH_XMU1422-2]|uniref:hypothetical protein n=1 Tax=Mesoflavibacter sp. CH_XMU1422-2 TaxID=3107770 RepID=UPI00300AD5C1